MPLNAKSPEAREPGEPCRLLHMNRKAASAALAVAVAVAAASLSLMTSSAGAASVSGVGRIIGKIDGISHDGEQSFVSGWACQEGVAAPIKIHVYADGGTGGRADRVLVADGEANFDDEPAVDAACGANAGHAHRFLVLLPRSALASGSGKRLYIHGIRLFGDVPNDAIQGSGSALPLIPGLAPPYPTLPAIEGRYRSSADHPRVFVDSAEIRGLAARINRPTSYSAHRFRQLASQVRADLATRIDWDAAYSGCRVKTYLFAFAYEPQEPGFAATLRSDLQLEPGRDAPAGGAVVAARLALYAALLRAGAARPDGSPDAEAAAGLAKRILLAWADRGFRDAHGRFQTVASFDCDDDGKADVRPDAGTGLGLALGRGVVYSVHAQDLLTSMGVLSSDEGRRLDAMHAALFDLIRQSSNKGYGTYEPTCNRYSNGQANAVAAMVAVARLLDDHARFEAALIGGDASVPVVTPWVRLFDHALYGHDDVPSQCFPNTGPTAATSHPSYQGSVVAAGEVDDRYRNANPSQGIGYAMFTLERLMNAAEVMRHAGYEAYGYRGRHAQSLESAVAYHACLAKAVGFGKTVTTERARMCPDAAQYDGKLVNGVDPLVLFGADRFSGNQDITALESQARVSAESGPFSSDALMFGKWRD